MFVLRIARRFSVAAVAAAFSAALLWGTPALADRGFARWVANFRSAATSSGVSGRTLDRAFADVTEPDPDVLEKAHKQPEFKDPVWDYFDNRVHDESIANGKAMARKWKPWL